MSCATQDLIIQKGKTFSRVLRWESGPFLYKPITNITRAAPVAITSVAHGVPDGWRVTIVSVQGMVEINSLNIPPRDEDYHAATVIGANTIELNDINSTEFEGYNMGGSGGYIQFRTPVDLAGFTARMQIRSSLTATTFLLELTTTNGRIAIDNALKTITLLVDAVTTAAITWKTGVYDLELVSGGVVTQLLSGTVTVSEEATR